MWEIATITVLLALAFTFTNGFQDASAIAATFIASRSATPRQGIILVAGMVFLGTILGGTAVAFTLSGLITSTSGDQTVAITLAALAAATGWNILTWHYGLPSSSTHAIVGGLVGAAVAAGGLGSVYWGLEELLMPPHALEGLTKILVFLVVSVLIGFAGSFLLQKTTSVLLRNADRSVNRELKRLNWIAAAAMAFSNGSNDSQKQLGIIALVLFAAGQTAAIETPFGIRVALALAIGLGTLSGGWRIMNTLGRRIFEIEPVHSFDSQLSSGISIALSTAAGAPVSSTHIISTSIIGVGAAANPKKVHWPVGRDILAAMVLTIPITMLLAAFVYLLISSFTGA
jgi:PiT family inorganic phosphate transporter